MEAMLLLFLLLLLLIAQPLIVQVHAQQAYVNNKQLDCYNQYNSTDGNVCNNGGGAPKCGSYLTFRSIDPYTNPVTIAYLLGSTAPLIASLNNISTVDPIPVTTPVLVPVTCSCSAGFYQHNASYTLQATAGATETYFSVANNTFQGLTTCQALIEQNPFDARNLTRGSDLLVPLRCACPSQNQTESGFTYLLSYIVTWGDSVDSISAMFGADPQSILDANMLSPTDVIFPFTPLLVPLKTEPTKILFSSPPPPPPSTTATTSPNRSSNKWVKWVFVGVGVGVGVAVLALVFVLWRRRRQSKREALPSSVVPGKKMAAESTGYSSVPEDKSWSLSSEGLRVAVESLTLYKFEHLRVATGDFSEGNRIEASVYKGSFKGDSAAVKVMKGDVSGEINILKMINHTNIIRLSGFCLHNGDTYLVYEYAENGSLADWLHSSNSKNQLSWKQRVQIAYDIADGLNYLHNYTNPPYVHKNLKTSNVLLDANFRAKIGNFGLARSVENDKEGELQMTRHVVGTKGYMAPEYIENGVITPKLDVFALGVVILELMSGKEAVAGDKNKEEVLWASIAGVLQGENVREKLKGFMDPALEQEYPLDLAFSLAQLAKGCVAPDLTSRFHVSEVFMTLSKILSSTLDWDPSDAFDNSRSFSGR